MRKVRLNPFKVREAPEQRHAEYHRKGHVLIPSKSGKLRNVGLQRRQGVADVLIPSKSGKLRNWAAR